MTKKLDRKFNRQTPNDEFIFYINFWLIAHTTVLTTAPDLVITWNERASNQASQFFIIRKFP